MKKVPQYYQQERDTTCSLAVLRMVLEYYDIEISEYDLIKKVTPLYGEDFENIWNPTVAKIAVECGIQTTFIAEWPLLKQEVMKKAYEDYKSNPDAFRFQAYENANDADSMTEPLSLSYTEMFQAYAIGCNVEYGKVDHSVLHQLHEPKKLMLVTIILEEFYPGTGRRGFHSLLLYDIDKDTVSYHDPSYGKSCTIKVDWLLRSLADVGAGIVFEGRSSSA